MKIFILFLLSLSSLMSANFSAHYDVDVSLFGKVGYINIDLKEEKDSYEMSLVAKTSGTAAALTNDRIETYISTGKVVDGVYMPDKFVKIKKTNHKTRTQTYFFDHKKKTIKLVEEKEKLIVRNDFDPISFKIVEKLEKEHKTKEELLDRYHSNDVLSSYINTRNTFSKKREYILEAIGAHNDEKDVSLYLLDDKQKEQIISHFSSDTKRVCNLHVEPHDKDDSVVDVLMAFDEDDNLKEAYLGDIFWIGKIVAKRMEHSSTCDIN